jgi:acyl-homoserine-lactone acylase
MGLMLRFSSIVVAIWLISGCQSSSFDADRYAELNQRYEVVIRRDVRGVPHVLGATDPDTAFGFAYAQAEDNWQLIEDAMPLYRGNSAVYSGMDGAVTDYLVKWLGLWDTLNENYQWDLSPDTRAYVEAYADGLNFYAATHPDEVDERKLPVTAKDVVAGHMLRHLLFYGFDGVVREVNKAERQREISQPKDFVALPADRKEITLGGLPIGSNAFAIAPHFSEEGATRLAINSHQPTTGPVAWYEAHIQSKTGLNVMGGLFPGSPSISVGFTENIAWGATVNRPDLVDVYVLEINPDNEYQYRLDGEWRDLERRDVDIKLTLWGFFPWTVSREVLASEHGPVLRTDHGTYAIRFAGMGELRQVEQWYRMNQATSFDEWRDAMAMKAFASFNFAYADKDGNIMFLHNSLTPRRDPRYDWSQYIPGDDSSLIWKETLGFSQMPQVINPASGFVHSANQTPFNVTSEADNPKPEDFAPGHGFQMDMTNRAQRGLELFAELGPISEAEFSAIKHDKYYSPNTPYVSYLQQIATTEFSDPGLVQAQDLLASWDLGTDLDNNAAALGTCVLLAAERDAERAQHSAGQTTELLGGCVDKLMLAKGRIDPPWGEVNRHVRGELNLPVAGGPDILRAIYGRGLEDNGYLTNVAGDGLYYLVSWAADGAQKVEGVHQFGSATLNESSPHYADQAQDYAKEVLHDPLFREADLQANLAREYAPGEE